MRLLHLLAALSGFCAVALGAFAAHGADARAAELLRTGAHYQLVHAAAVFALNAALPRARAALVLFLAGSAVFAGSLYGLAFGAPRLVGAVTPLGGLCLLAGWLAAGWAAWRRPAEG